MILTVSRFTAIAAVLSGIASTAYAFPVFSDDSIDARTSEEQPLAPPSVAQALLRVAGSSSMPYYPDIVSAVIKGVKTHSSSRRDLELENWVRSALQDDLDIRGFDEDIALEARVLGVDGGPFSPAEFRKGFAAAPHTLRPKDPASLKAATTSNPAVASKVPGSTHFNRALGDLFLGGFGPRVISANGHMLSPSQMRTGLSAAVKSANRPHDPTLVKAATTPFNPATIKKAFGNRKREMLEFLVARKIVGDLD